MKIKLIRVITRLSVALNMVLVINSSFSQEKKELLIVTYGNSTTAPRKGIEKVYAVRIHEELAAAGIPNKVINASSVNREVMSYFLEPNFARRNYDD